ncbi:GNAT family N-acetyltransferase [Mesobacillus jeotgali]|uniref:GNAT family N-acetyltransferase n=1 Tax=Mesobacillus jeotgali TaxID=129985 RepID=UPI00159051E2|nr:GNAT family N-acetyltransferase [Mesobacillus jeotgali]
MYASLIDGKIIGSFGIKKVAELHVAESGNYLYQIAIQPEYQGRGYGALLTSWACKYSRGMGEDLYLNCWAGNEKLKNFYSENGFEYVGDFPEEDYYISIFKCSASGVYSGRDV